MTTTRRAIVSFAVAVCVLAAGGGALTWALARGAVGLSAQVDVDGDQASQVIEGTAWLVQRLVEYDRASHRNALDDLPPSFPITLDDSVE